MSANSFLCLDFGAGTLKAAEFEITESGSLCLKNFGLKSLGPEGVQEAARERVLGAGLEELIAVRSLAAKRMNACAPGFHVFSKFVKLPPVDTSKVIQIIQYEALQNIPFPLEEVVWDYQITGATPAGTLEAFLVAIKSDLVESLFRVAESAGLRLELVDVSVAAVCNAFRFNYGELEDCSMLLDIGARSSNVLFFEKGKFSARSINIGAHSITQDFAIESRMPFTKAEQYKIAEGFVSLGGAYEEPENPQQAQISKIARQFMTRLHLQVNQTIQFYRGQQGGSAPVRLFLGGGASIMPYTAQFFSEKLNLPVEYFNPLRNVKIDPAVNLEELAKVAHCLGETVGLGLRNLAQCPLELNLMPKSIRQRQAFAERKPYFIATAACIALALLMLGWFYDAKIISPEREFVTELQAKIKPLQTLWNTQFAPLEQQIATLRRQADQLAIWIHDRVYWVNLLTQIRAALIETEAATDSTRALVTNDARSGVWIEKCTPEIPGEEEEVQSTEAAAGPAEPYWKRMPLAIRKRYGFPLTDVESSSATETAPATNEITTVRLTCAAVNLSRYSPQANPDLVSRFAGCLRKRTDLFIPGETRPGPKYLGSALPTRDAPTFSFEMILRLRRPIPLP